MSVANIKRLQGIIDNNAVDFQFFELYLVSRCRRQQGFQMSVPWIEKYRPKNLSQISSQSETVNILQKTLQSGNVF